MYKCTYKVYNNDIVKVTLAIAWNKFLYYRSVIEVSTWEWSQLVPVVNRSLIALNDFVQGLVARIVVSPHKRQSCSQTFGFLFESSEARGICDDFIHSRSFLHFS